MSMPPPDSLLDWLLEPDDPGVRYLALRDLCHLPPADPLLERARQDAYTQGPISLVLDAMQPDGYWERPGSGYNPKYFSTVWALILLAQLGASVDHDPRLAQACRYLLENNLNPGGQFSSTSAPSGTVDCLQGNLCWALVTLGYDDPRLEAAYDWMARSVTGEGIAPQEDRGADSRYYAYKCGPLFACGVNYRQPCAWGAAKVMNALAVCPSAYRSPQVEQALRLGVDFLLGTDPATAAYPSGESGKPSRSWWKFGFPVFYVTDILQIAEVLGALGYGKDPRLVNAWQLIVDKQDAHGRWKLEYDYRGKTYGDYGDKNAPSKWVTLRALRALASA